MKNRSLILLKIYSIHPELITGVAELVDALDLGPSNFCCESSSLSIRNLISRLCSITLLRLPNLFHGYLKHLSDDRCFKIHSRINNLRLHISCDKPCNFYLQF